MFVDLIYFICCLLGGVGVVFDASIEWSLWVVLGRFRLIDLLVYDCCGVDTGGDVLICGAVNFN